MFRRLSYFINFLVLYSCMCVCVVYVCFHSVCVVCRLLFCTFISGTRVVQCSKGLALQLTPYRGVHEQRASNKKILKLHLTCKVQDCRYRTFIKYVYLCVRRRFCQNAAQHFVLHCVSIGRRTFRRVKYEIFRVNKIKTFNKKNITLALELRIRIISVIVIS